MPDSLNRGVIIILHKGGRERKDDPTNYRAITLTSVLLKLYEMVLLHRCKSNMLEGLSTQQGGFQEHLECTMTSFVLRECIYFTHEQHSKLYVCFLDGKQAFARVRHLGMLYKLHSCVDQTTLSAIRNIYDNMPSCVSNQGVTSYWLPILQ